MESEIELHIVQMSLGLEGGMVTYNSSCIGKHYCYI